MKHAIAVKVMELKEKCQSGTPKATVHSGFDFAKNIRLVPKFDANEVTRYFTSFEDFAKKLEWPKSTGLHYFMVFLKVKQTKCTLLSHLNKAQMMMW